MRLLGWLAAMSLALAGAAQAKALKGECPDGYQVHAGLNTDFPAGGQKRAFIVYPAEGVSGPAPLWVPLTGSVESTNANLTVARSGANALMYGARLIRNNIVDVAIAGGADALTRFTLNGFNTLMILDQQPCRPFDETRTGLNLGEGAGYVVLVSDSLAAQLQPWCRLSGFANANDAYHQTASSPDGTGNYLAMKGALDMSGLQPQQIGYINLHGTGTQNNDVSEGIAINRLFAPHFPAMSSTKSFTGHTLGASGGIEAVFSALAVKEGIIYPNARFEHQMKELPFAPAATYSTGHDLQHVMSNSFGFGGNCSSLVFSKG